MNNEPRHIEVTLLHVLILFASVAVIGTLLFWGGYRSGRNAAMATLKSSQDLPVIQSGENRSVETVSDPVAVPTQGEEHQDAPPPTEPELPPSIPPAAQAQNEAVRLHQATVREQLQQEPSLQQAAPPPKAAVRSAQGEYAVQTGSFESHREASQHANRFIAKGVPTQVVRVKVKGRTMFRVLAGAYSSHAQASGAISSLEAIGGKKGYFVQKTR